MFWIIGYDPGGDREGEGVPALLCAVNTVPTRSMYRPGLTYFSRFHPVMSQISFPRRQKDEGKSVLLHVS